MTRRRYALLLWIGLAVSAVSAYLTLRKTDLTATWAAIEQAEYAWVAPALAALVAAFFIRVQRWRLLYARERRPRFGQAARALFIGYFFNNILPARAGEVARTVALWRRTRIPMAETAATIIVERVLDVLSLLAVLFVISRWLPHVTWLRTAAVAAIALVAAVAVAVAVFVRYRERPLAALVRPLARLPIVSSEAVERAPGSFVSGLSGLLRPVQALAVFAITTLSWAVLGAGFWVLTLAYDLDLSPLAGMVVVIAIGLGMILPSSPAALGVFEGATVIALSAYGVSTRDAVPYALVLHALNVLPFIVLAVPMLGLPALRRSRDGVTARLPAR